MHHKKNLLAVLLFLVGILFVAESCAEKTNCGTKRQHKQRSMASKKMAPTM